MGAGLRHDRAIPAIPLLMAVFVGSGLIGCSNQLRAAANPPSSAVERASAFHEGQVVEAASREVISFDTLLDRLEDQDVVYLGEEHYNRYHVAGAITVLNGLLARGRRPVLALEMFGWDGQEALDAYLSEQPVDRERFLRESGWARNWGGGFHDYEPLIEFAREHHLPVVAMNPPRLLVRTVAKKGLRRALEDPETARWGMRNEIPPDDPEYRDVIMRQLRQCHGGMSDATYERIYEASVFRDEGMAKTIVGQLRQADGARGPIVSYTGGGHIQRGLPVPRRVARRSQETVKQATIAMHALEPDHPEHTQELLDERIADYVWLTPIGEHGPPARC